MAEVLESDPRLKIADRGRNVSDRDVVHVCASVWVGIISELCPALLEIL